MPLHKKIIDRFKRSREIGRLAELVFKHQNPGPQSNSPENQAVRMDIKKRLRKGTFEPSEIRNRSSRSTVNRTTGYPANRRKV